MSRNGHPAVQAFFDAAKARGVTLYAVARDTGISRSAIVEWGTRRNPTVQNLEAACNVVGLRLVAVPMETNR